MAWHSTWSNRGPSSAWWKSWRHWKSWHGWYQSIRRGPSYGEVFSLQKELRESFLAQVAKAGSEKTCSSMMSLFAVAVLWEKPQRVKVCRKGVCCLLYYSMTSYSVGVLLSPACCWILYLPKMSVRCHCFKYEWYFEGPLLMNCRWPRRALSKTWKPFLRHRKRERESRGGFFSDLDVFLFLTYTYSQHSQPVPGALILTKSWQCSNPTLSHQQDWVLGEPTNCRFLGWLILFFLCVFRSCIINR